MWVEYAMQSRAFKSEVIFAMTGLFGLGSHFVMIQTIEFTRLSFTYQDSVYGSLFYAITGLHFLHILVGAFLLFIAWCRVFFRGTFE